MNPVTVSDPTLRDGSHAVGHQLTAAQVAAYCRAADRAGVAIVEVGHGNGLGASSLLLGRSRLDDAGMLATARAHLARARLGVHFIPGFATIRRDLEPALDSGVDVVRVATHCTEADLSRRYLEFTRSRGRTAFGVLMMSHLASTAELLAQARLMQGYGAEAVVLMDSAGAYLPADVTERVERLAGELDVPVGFHAHDNLGLAIANTVAAVAAGATLVDGTARGFGAGAGNAPIELLVAVLGRMGYDTGIALYAILDAAELAEREILREMPAISSTSIVSGLAGVFSGFKRPVLRIAAELGVDPRDIFMELGRRGIIAGQEDYIFEVAAELARRQGQQNTSARSSMDKADQER